MGGPLSILYLCLYTLILIEHLLCVRQRTRPVNTIINKRKRSSLHHGADILVALSLIPQTGAKEMACFPQLL